MSFIILFCVTKERQSIVMRSKWKKTKKNHPLFFGLVMYLVCIWAMLCSDHHCLQCEDRSIAAFFFFFSPTMCVEVFGFVCADTFYTKCLRSKLTSRSVTVFNINNLFAFDKLKLVFSVKTTFLKKIRM